MKWSRRLSVFCFLTVVILLTTVPNVVGNADAPTRSPSLLQFQPGNYCVSCHTPGDQRLTSVMA